LRHNFQFVELTRVSSTAIETRARDLLAIVLDNGTMSAIELRVGIGASHIGFGETGLDDSYTASIITP
jgi:hypothetical protein